MAQHDREGQNKVWGGVKKQQTVGLAPGSSLLMVRSTGPLLPTCFVATMRVNRGVSVGPGR